MDVSLLAFKPERSEVVAVHSDEVMRTVTCSLECVHTDPVG